MALMFVIFILEKNGTPKKLLLPLRLYENATSLRKKKKKEEAFTDPTMENINSEKVIRGALHSEGHTPHSISSQVLKGCQDKAGDSQFQQTHNVRDGSTSGGLTDRPPC